MNIRRLFIWSLLATLALWFTGIVAVPFANETAATWLTMIGFKSDHMAWWTHQLENLIYAIGRLPILFATLVALSAWEGAE